MHKRTIYILSLIFFISSCGTFESVKQGLTGQKKNSTDEFLIQKKDPLILPPDYENLPTPDDEVARESDEISDFEKSLEISIEESSSTPGSAEESILKKIQNK